MDCDAAIIGGSFAGLSAALPLARARRRVVVVDTGLRRNRFAGHSHNFFGQDGASPADMVAVARQQLLRYATVHWLDDAVDAAEREGDAFALRTAGGQRLHARRLVLASGVVDHLPEVAGLRERWGRSVFHCPYCHGYELDQGPIGVLAAGPMSLHQAMLLPEWGTVTLFLNGALVLDEPQRRELAARGVQVDATPVRAIVNEATVLLADGREVALAGLFTATRTEPASPLARQLGCEFEEGPLGPVVKTDAQKATSAAGVFACGDMARAAGSVALAVGDGAMAGTAAHRSLVFPA